MWNSIGGFCNDSDEEVYIVTALQVCLIPSSQTIDSLIPFGMYTHFENYSFSLLQTLKFQEMKALEFCTMSSKPVCLSFLVQTFPFGLANFFGLITFKTTKL